MFEDSDQRGTTQRAVAALATAAASLLVLSAPAGAGVRSDFNDDGFEDLAIGVEGEDLPSPEDVLNSGAVHVIYGSGSGLDPAGSPADQFWHEEVAGVRGNGTGDDGFGDAVAAGDFDGDGHADLAIGVVGDVVDGEEYAGSVRVLYGANSGLTAQGDDRFTEATTGVPGTPAQDDMMGDTLAAGDFDGDGRDDLAVWISGERVQEPDAGAVLVFPGSGQGLTAEGVKRWTEDSKGIAGVPQDFDQFGQSLAAARLDGDKREDLAIGVPIDNVGGLDGAGTVRVLFGSGQGLTRQGARRIHPGQGSIGGDPEAGDLFGWSLAAGKLDNDKFADLAIGVPNDLTGGAVTVLYGGGQGPSTNASQVWSQGSTDVEGDPADGDRFGDSVAIGDFDDDSRGDLAVGVPNEPVGALADAGSINVLYSGAGGLTAVGDQLFNQGTLFVEGTAEASDKFGSALAAGDFDDGGGDDLAIAVLYDDAGAVDGAGSVAVLRGSSPDGLTVTDDQLFHEGLPEIQSEPTASEFFGYSVAAGASQGD